MLYPQINRSRAMLDLNGLWKFKLLRSESEFTPGMLIKEDFEWLAVPASYNDQKEHREYRRFAGLVLYQKEVEIPEWYKRERLVLRFDAVTNAAIVYVADMEIVRHKGGYLPFEVTLSEDILAQKKLVITVLVDNRVSGSSLPVGNDTGTVGLTQESAKIPSVEAAERYRKQKNLPNFDFFNYAGMNRPVRIYTTPKEYIEDVTIVTDIKADGTTGVVSYEVCVNGRENSNAVVVIIMDENGTEIAKTEGKKGTIIIPKANFWWPAPETPYLYKACITYGTDTYVQTFGIRTIKVEGTKFLINGKPFYFKGFGKHEDFAIHGRGTNLCLDVKDAGLIHWLNANSFRTSHYPYAEEMYDLCDREGIVIIDEVPAVGIRALHGADAYKVFDICKHHEVVLKEMIQRDKNHPCVVMWSLGNEADMDVYPESAYNYWTPLYKLAHELDAQNRPVTLVSFLNDYTKDITTRTMDVVSLNRYYGWYDLTGDLDAAAYALEVELNFWETMGKPVLFTEFGADSIAGIHATVPEMFTEEYQAEFLLMYGRCFDKRDFVIGEQLWNFADFGTAQGTMRVDGNKKGLFTRERRPKMAAHVMKKRWSKITNFHYK